jgi:hypothetical protein
LHELSIVVRRLAGHADDERAVMVKRRDHLAEGLQAGVLEPVAVHEAWSGRRHHANQVRLGVAGSRADRDALRGHGAEAESHRPPEDARVVVHRRQYERAGEADPRELHGEPRILDGERPERSYWERAKQRLAEADRRGLGEPGEQATVDQAIKAVGERREHRARRRIQWQGRGRNGGASSENWTNEPLLSSAGRPTVEGLGDDRKTTQV